MEDMPDAVIEDPWQARLDRMRRLLPMPLLLASTVVALFVAGRQHTWARFELGLPAVAATAVWWAVVTARVRPDASTRWRLTVFAVHTALAGFLVWVTLPYGIFAYIGFLLAYRLDSRWRTAGFVATALVVSAAMAGGYPSGNAGQTITYLVVAGVLVALTMNSASITNRVLEQNQERGQMISELAEANRRLETSMAENAELHAQLVTQAREAGIVEERQRLAGEIHDTLAQGLTGIIAQLEAAEHTRNHPDTWPRHVTQARALARASLTEARRSVRALRPGQLEEASLPEGGGQLARGDRHAGAHLVGGVDDRRRSADDRHRGPGRPRHRGGRVPGRSGGTVQRGQARTGGQGADHPDLPRRYPAARRGRRRNRLRRPCRDRRVRPGRHAAAAEPDRRDADRRVVPGLRDHP